MSSRGGRAGCPTRLRLLARRRWRDLDRGQTPPGAARVPSALLLAAIRLELAHKGPEIVDFLLVLDAREDHLGARHLGARILDVLLERRLAPGNARILVGVAVVEALRGAGLAAVEPVELGADLVLGVFADVMARHAFLEGALTGLHVLGERHARRHS